MWWIVWIVLMVLVPCLEGLYVIWELRVVADELPVAGSQPAGCEP